MLTPVLAQAFCWVLTEPPCYLSRLRRSAEPSQGAQKAREVQGATHRRAGR